MFVQKYFSQPIFIIACALFISPAGFVIAQSQNELYQTRNGIINILLPYYDSTITVHSNNLIVLLDYNTAYVEIELPYAMMHTGIDSIDAQLLKSEDKSIKLNAKLGISYINTHNHPPQHFRFDGKLTINLIEVPVYGEGHLVHLIGGESIDCRLGMNFEIDPETINYNSFNNLNHTQKTIQVTIVQSVLDRLK